MSVLSGRVFADSDSDNQDNGEAGVRWILVQLRSPDGQIVAQTRTAADGSYSFEGVDAGDYVIRFGRDSVGREYVTPNIGDDSSDSDATPHRNGVSLINNVTVGADDTVTDLDAGLALPRPDGIEGRAFLDDNGNGVYDRGVDQLASGVAVTLYDFDGNAISQTVTDANGQYQFAIEQEGPSYQVGFDLESGGQPLIAADQGPDARDSDVDPATGMATTGLDWNDTGAGYPRIDAGYGATTEVLGSISGRVFEDTNGNGVDDNEPGLGGVALTINVQGIYDRDVIIFSQADGSYEFTDLPPGTYHVELLSENTTLSDGREVIAPDLGDDDRIDSDFQEYYPYIGLGATPVIGEYDIYVSTLAPHVQDVDLGLTPAPTGDDLASVNGRIFQDLNANGVDDNEPGIAGVIVYLYVGRDHWSNSPIIAVSNSDGEYSFSGINPVDDNVDEYNLVFSTSVDGFRATQTNVGDDDSIDSDGPWVNFDLQPGDNLTDIDQGYIPTQPDNFIFEV